jgi:ubiquinone/menaquinone biosynthesis C-methylase UbiE
MLRSYFSWFVDLRRATGSFVRDQKTSGRTIATAMTATVRLVAGVHGRSHHDANPMTTSQDTRAAEEFYTRISRVYDALANSDEQTAREVGLKLLDARASERVLEIGFGTGTAIVPIARAVGDRGRVLGVDIADGMRHVAEQRVASAGLSATVDLRVAAIPPIPATDRAFDAVFMAFTLELFPDDTIPSVLREIQRVLTPRGRLVVVTMDLGDQAQRQRFAERTYRWFHRHFPHIVDCRPIDVASHLTSAGFTIARVETLEIWGLAVKACLAMTH